MKKLLLVGAVLVLTASSAWSLGEQMTAGPGGRIYITHWYNPGAGTTYRSLYSMAFGTDWSVTDRLQDHGDWLDNAVGLLEAGSVAVHRDSATGGSPEIETLAGNPQTGYANLVLSAANNSPLSPVSSMAPTAGAAVAQMIRVTPTDGSFGLTQFGAGRAAGGSDCNTDGIIATFPDMVGQYTGAAGRYVTSGTNAAHQTSQVKWKITKSVAEAGDGDPTDDTSDYLVVGIARTAQDLDVEIYRDRLYSTASYGPNSGSDGIWYTSPGDGYTQHAYYDRKIGTLYGGPDFQLSGTTGSLAVGTAKDDQGGEHIAVYCPIGQRAQIWAFVDWNDDGDAHDNAATTGTRDEFFKVYDSTWTGFADLTYSPDLEFLEGPDGTNFLVHMPNQAHNVPFIRVMQLADNGELMATNAATPSEWWAHLTLKDDSDLNILPASATFSMEVDYGHFTGAAAVIPEPGTMLLLGTGVLAVAGYIRRRRMK